jgi:hypothetical protein
VYRVINIITIKRNKTADFPDRKGEMIIPFLESYNVQSTWESLTDTGSITFPKNLYYKNEFGTLQRLNGTDVNIGGFNGDPLILRGDSVTLNVGYRYFDKTGKEIIDTENIFSGYVSKVSTNIPIEIELQDNMYILKQTSLKPKTFTDKNTLEDILKYIIEGTNLTIDVLTTTNLGPFTIGNETSAQVLNRLQSTYNLDAYFNGNTLICGVFRYREDKIVTHLFDFEKNIIDSNLEFNRKDDLKLSAIAYNNVTEAKGGTTKDGKTRTTKKRIEVLVELNNSANGYVLKEPTENKEGERRTFFFIGAKTKEELGKLAYEKLKQYYYDGLKGSFTTFAIPFVKMGDNVKLNSKRYPERNGTYKVKKVVATGGVGGLRQEITLDYRIITAS